MEVWYLSAFAPTVTLGTCVTRGMEFVCLMSAEGDHGLVQEDQGELRRVCCCAAHVNDIRVYCMHDVTSYTLLHALLQPSRRRTVSLLL